MKIVTGADMAKARRIVEVMTTTAVTPGYEEWKTDSAKKIAEVLAEFREEILSCAVVRVEREFKVKARELPSGSVANQGDRTE